MTETEIIPLEVAYPYYDLSEVEIWEDPEDDALI